MDAPQGQARMTDGNILHLVNHLVFELDCHGHVQPINQRAVALLERIGGASGQMLQTLFQLDDPKDAYKLAESRDTHNSTLVIDDSELLLKWEFVKRSCDNTTCDGEDRNLFCFAVEWEPFQALVEKVQRKNLMFKELLLNVLPHHVAESLIANKAIRPKAYRGCSILFTDVVSFSRLSFHLDPVSLIRKLNSYYSLYDDLMLTYGIEKIKTIGDAYMCVAGLPNKKDTHAVDCAMAALQMVKVTQKKQDEVQMVPGEELDLNNWQIRVGIHSGPCISGVVGHQKYVFDIWGDSVNVAARMESASEASQINISSATHDEIKPFFDCTYRGNQYVKNIGVVEMFFVDGIKPALSVDGAGLQPNDDFCSLYCDTFRITPKSRSLRNLPLMIQDYVARQS